MAGFSPNDEVHTIAYYHKMNYIFLYICIYYHIYHLINSIKLNAVKRRQGQRLAPPPHSLAPIKVPPQSRTLSSVTQSEILKRLTMNKRLGKMLSKGFNGLRLHKYLVALFFFGQQKVFVNLSSNS